LKCYARLYINLETANASGIELDHDGSPFDVQQDETSGSIFIANVTLKAKGHAYKLWRPLNSRAAWPLYLVTEEDEDIAVFNDDGSFSSEMLTFLSR